MRRRLLLVHPARPGARRALRRVRRSCLRRAIHHPTRHVLPDRGPSLNSLFTLCNRSLRVIERLHRKLNPPSRFQTLATPEEQRRQMDEDLKRTYGDDSSFISPRNSPAAASAPSLPSASPPAPASSPDSHPPVRRSASDEGGSTRNSQPVSKSDLMAVPLVFSPHGLLTLDWRNARPA